MKTPLLLGFAALSSFLFAQASDESKNTNASGGTATGGSADGGAVTGGTVTGGTVTGGTVTGGNVTGGDAKGGTVTPGTVTPGTVTPGRVAARVGNLEITATAPGALAINSKNGTATVTMGNHILTVKNAQILLEGTELAKIPLGTSKVSFVVKDQLLTVRADGKKILSRELKEE